MPIFHSVLAVLSSDSLVDMLIIARRLTSSTLIRVSMRNKSTTESTILFSVLCKITLFRNYHLIQKLTIELESSLDKFLWNASTTQSGKSANFLNKVF